MYEYFPNLYSEFNIFFKSLNFKKTRKDWLLEDHDYIILFKLRKNTIIEKVYIDYGLLLKFVDLPIAFSELDWHLGGTLGMFNIEYAGGICSDTCETQIDDLKTFIEKKVIPELHKIASNIKLKNFNEVVDLKYVHHNNKYTLEAIREWASSPLS